MKFTGRTVVVTGGAQGLGEAIVRGFASEGANVVIADILGPAARRLATELGSVAFPQMLDVTAEASWSDALRSVEQRFGGVDVLVNNAGVTPRVLGDDPAGPRPLIEDADIADWRRVFDVNLFGCVLGTKAVVPFMRRAGSGAIVNVGSVVAHQAQARLGAYVSSKWAVRGFTKAAAIELATYGIRVNAVHPGFIATPLMSAALAAAEKSATGSLAIPRFARPAEIAELVMFCASEAAAYSTGGDFVADGGLVLGPVQHGS